MIVNRIEENLKSILAKNRAEELGYDVWQHFVVPPFYNRLDLQTARKPRLIIGGRGCGKTMLLRYLSHQSMFSRSRKDIPDSAISHLGLFWRTDTNFASLMLGRNVSEDIWQSAFAHLAAILLGIEVLGCLQSIANSSSSLLEGKDIIKLDFTRLQAFDPTLPTNANDLQRNLESRLWIFESWVSNIRKVEEPIFLPGEKFVLAIIKEIQNQLPSLKDSIFYVYVDEYENLQKYQQKIINTWLKHSEVPLIFNLAMKKNAFETRETTGPESLSDIHDFRQHDLEQYILEEKTGVFFAEILFLELYIAGIKSVPIDIAGLRDPERLEERKNSQYAKNILEAIQRMLPDVPHENLAKDVFEEPALSKKLYENIEKALKFRNSGLSAEPFYRSRVPEATIVTPALLYRKRNKPEDVLNELDKLEKGEVSRFKGSTDWIHNNFVAGLLQLYEPYNRACPFYAGFQTFLILSRGNIRHFLELTYKSFERAFAEGISLGNTIDPKLQADAARQTSTSLLGEIKSFGPRGNQLHTFVLRLGSIFSLAHQRLTLSETEQSHFSIVSGSKELEDNDFKFLQEAVKWSVLFEEEETKSKDKYSPEIIDYVLNPIYTPYFHISYRKKRKLELKSDDVICLIRGSYEQVSTLIRRFSKQWDLEPSEASPTLFSHLIQED